ncbi:hypothetical protein B0I18_101547 [Taibaiella chishuiensis]|uniref:Uncharacterized protein n=1 Tax=Taibaiella chishuiensis TaxID=1434707 RepID=A0A2P8DAZ2_9BACT|nr:hypothetical protein B0I18_101547 [Taibaiella chishuiensis]
MNLILGDVLTITSLLPKNKMTGGMAPVNVCKQTKATQCIVLRVKRR